ncbi:MAG: glutathione S-transferase family protein, partial [Dehalococcoidia bacterium]
RLHDMIDVSVVSPLMWQHGWEFAQNFPGASGDRLHGLDRLYELYLRADRIYSGRVTVPVLWDREQETIVSNESAEIIRMFNSSFDSIGAAPGDFYPESLRSEIDAWNTAIYNPLNNGVYRCGFATTQEAYDEAVSEVFQALEAIETTLSRSRYLTGNRLTEADIRLWPTLVRFDAVYVTHFKCDRKRIVDYPNIDHYLRDIFQIAGLGDTVNLDHIRHHYFRSHESINPHRIVSRGPDLNFGAPHDRARFGSRELR